MADLGGRRMNGERPNMGQSGPRPLTISSLIAGRDDCRFEQRRRSSSGVTHGSGAGSEASPVAQQRLGARIFKDRAGNG